MSRYQVPKHKVEVTVRTSQGTEERVHIFLAEFAESHTGVERPEDVFNGSRDFAVVENELGEICFLGRDTISMITVPHCDADASDAMPVTEAGGGLDTEVPVEITLDDGTRLEGITRYQMPEARRRLQDFLNAAPPFVTLYRKGAVVIVNKRRIARIASR